MNGAVTFKERDLSLVTCYATWTHLDIMGFSVARAFHTLICCMPAAVYRHDIFEQCVCDLCGYKHFMYSNSVQMQSSQSETKMCVCKDVEGCVDFKTFCVSYFPFAMFRILS